MVISSDELSRLADEAYGGRRISDSLYCATCGYNLRTLPYVYRCPECGSGYNARPLAMKGIFLPVETFPPVGDALILILFVGMTGFTFYCGVNPPDAAWLVTSAVFALMAVHRALRGWARHLAYLRYRDVARRIAAEKGEE